MKKRPVVNYFFLYLVFFLWGRRARADGTYGDVGTGPHQVLAATLPLFQADGADHADHILMSPLGPTMF